VGELRRVGDKNWKSLAICDSSTTAAA
jgi:hypothetical protein